MLLCRAGLIFIMIAARCNLDALVDPCLTGYAVNQTVIAGDAAGPPAG